MSDIKNPNKLDSKKDRTSMPFGPTNYKLLLLGIAILILGYILLSLDDFVDAREFSVSLYIAPVVIVAGYLEIIYAIMYRGKSRKSQEAVGDQAAN